MGCRSRALCRQASASKSWELVVEAPGMSALSKHFQAVLHTCAAQCPVCTLGPWTKDLLLGRAWQAHAEHRDLQNGCAKLGTNNRSSSITTRPRGPMDKASAYGAGDCRFESCRGHSFHGVACLRSCDLGRPIDWPTACMCFHSSAG